MKFVSKNYHLNKSGEYATKAEQYAIKGNYDKAGYYRTLSHKHAAKAKEKNRRTN